jgi:hypothetical protein
MVEMEKDERRRIPAIVGMGDMGFGDFTRNLDAVMFVEPRCEGGCVMETGEIYAAIQERGRFVFLTPTYREWLRWSELCGHEFDVGTVKLNDGNGLERPEVWGDELIEGPWH